MPDSPDNLPPGSGSGDPHPDASIAGVAGVVRLNFDHDHNEAQLTQLATQFKTRMREISENIQRELSVTTSLGPVQASFTQLAADRQKQLADIRDSIKLVQQQGSIVGQTVSQQGKINDALRQQLDLQNKINQVGIANAKSLAQAQAAATKAAQTQILPATVAAAASASASGTTQAKTQTQATVDPAQLAELQRAYAAGSIGIKGITRQYEDQLLTIARLKAELRGLEAVQAAISKTFGTSTTASKSQTDAWIAAERRAQALQGQIKVLTSVTQAYEKQTGQSSSASSLHFANIARAIGTVNTAQQGLSGGGSALKSGVIGGLIGAGANDVLRLAETGVKNLGEAVVGYNARLESATVGTQQFVKDAKQAASVVDQELRLSFNSPFKLDQLLEGTRRLLAMGTAADQVIPRITTIAAAVSGVGGNQETFNRVVLAISQIGAKSILSAQDLRQLAEAGLPVFQILRERLHLTSEEVQNIGKAGIASGRGLDELLKGLDERFGSGLVLNLDTFSGRLNNMQGVLSYFVGQLGGPLTQELKKFFEQVSATLQDPGSLQAARALGDVIGNIAHNIRDFAFDDTSGLLGFLHMLPSLIGDGEAELLKFQLFVQNFKGIDVNLEGRSVLNFGDAPAQVAGITKFQDAARAEAQAQVDKTKVAAKLNVDVAVEIGRVQADVARAQVHVENTDKLDLSGFTDTLSNKVEGELAQKLPAGGLEALNKMLAALDKESSAEGSSGRSMSNVAAQLRETFLQELAKLGDSPSVAQIQAASDRLAKSLTIPGQFGGSDADKQVVQLARDYLELGAQQEALKGIQADLQTQQAAAKTASDGETASINSKTTAIKGLTDARKADHDENQRQLQDVRGKIEDAKDSIKKITDPRKADHDENARQIQDLRDKIQSKEGSIRDITDPRKEDHDRNEIALQNLRDQIESRTNDLKAATNAAKAEHDAALLQITPLKDEQTNLGFDKRLADRTFDQGITSAEAQTARLHSLIDPVLATVDAAHERAKGQLSDLEAEQARLAAGWSEINQEEARTISDLGDTRTAIADRYAPAIDKATAAEHANARAIKDANLDLREQLRTQDELINRVEDKNRAEQEGRDNAVDEQNMTLRAAQRAFNKGDRDLAREQAAALRAGDKDRVGAVKEQRAAARSAFEDSQDEARAELQVREDAAAAQRDQTTAEERAAKLHREQIQRDGQAHVDTLTRQGETLADNTSKLTDNRDAALSSVDAQIKLANEFAGVLKKYQQDGESVGKAELLQDQALEKSTAARLDSQKKLAIEIISGSDARVAALKLEKQAYDDTAGARLDDLDIEITKLERADTLSQRRAEDAAKPIQAVIDALHGQETDLGLIERDAQRKADALVKPIAAAVQGLKDQETVIDRREQKAQRQADALVLPIQKVIDGLNEQETVINRREEKAQRQSDALVKPLQAELDKLGETHKANDLARAADVERTRSLETEATKRIMALNSEITKIGELQALTESTGKNQTTRDADVAPKATGEVTAPNTAAMIQGLINAQSPALRKDIREEIEAARRTFAEKGDRTAFNGVATQIFDLIFKAGLSTVVDKDAVVKYVNPSVASKDLVEIDPRVFQLFEAIDRRDRETVARLLDNQQSPGLVNNLVRALVGTDTLQGRESVKTDLEKRLPTLAEIDGSFAARLTDILHLQGIDFTGKGGTISQLPTAATVGDLRTANAAQIQLDAATLQKEAAAAQKEAAQSREAAAVPGRAADMLVGLLGHTNPLNISDQLSAASERSALKPAGPDNLLGDTARESTRGALRHLLETTDGMKKFSQALQDHTAEVTYILDKLDITKDPKLAALVAEAKSGKSALPADKTPIATAASLIVGTNAIGGDLAKGQADARGYLQELLGASQENRRKFAAEYSIYQAGWDELFRSLEISKTPELKALIDKSLLENKVDPKALLPTPEAVTQATKTNVVTPATSQLAAVPEAATATGKEAVGNVVSGLAGGAVAIANAAKTGVADAHKEGVSGVPQQGRDAGAGSVTGVSTELQAGAPTVKASAQAGIADPHKQGISSVPGDATAAGKAASANVQAELRAGSEGVMTAAAAGAAKPITDALDPLPGHAAGVIKDVVGDKGLGTLASKDSLAAVATIGSTVGNSLVTGVQAGVSDTSHVEGLVGAGADLFDSVASGFKTRASEQTPTVAGNFVQGLIDAVAQAGAQAGQAGAGAGANAGAGVGVPIGPPGPPTTGVGFPIEVKNTAQLQSRITQGYKPGTGFEPEHSGVDFDTTTGDPIHAVADGVVTFAGWEGGDSGYHSFVVSGKSYTTQGKGYGLHVEIDHAAGGKRFLAIYGHMSVLRVSVGQLVRRGDVIALSGSTGYSTGSHLHLEFRTQAIPGRRPGVDSAFSPLPFIEQNLAGAPVTTNTKSPYTRQDVGGDVMPQEGVLPPGASTSTSAGAGAGAGAGVQQSRRPTTAREVVRGLITDLGGVLQDAGGSISVVTDAIVAGQTELAADKLKGYTALAVDLMRKAFDAIKQAAQQLGPNSLDQLKAIIGQSGVGASLDPAAQKLRDEERAGHPGFAILEKLGNVDDRSALVSLITFLQEHQNDPEFAQLLGALTTAGAGDTLAAVRARILTPAAGVGAGSSPAFDKLAALLERLGPALDVITAGDVQTLRGDRGQTLQLGELLNLLQQSGGSGGFAEVLLDRIKTGNGGQDDTIKHLSEVFAASDATSRRLLQFLLEQFGPGVTVGDVRKLAVGQDGKLIPADFTTAPTQHDPAARDLAARVRQAAIDARYNQNTDTRGREQQGTQDQALTTFLGLLQKSTAKTLEEFLATVGKSAGNLLSDAGVQSVISALQAASAQSPNIALKDLQGFLFGGDGFKPMDVVDATNDVRSAVDTTNAILLGATDAESINIWKALLHVWEEAAPKLVDNTQKTADATASTADSTGKAAEAAAQTPAAGATGSAGATGTSGATGTPDTRTPQQKALDEATQALARAQGTVDQLTDAMERALSGGDKGAIARVAQQLATAEAARDEAKRRADEAQAANGQGKGDGGVLSQDEQAALRRRMEFTLEKYEREAAGARARGDMASYNRAQARAKQASDSLDRMDHQARDLSGPDGLASVLGGLKGAIDPMKDEAAKQIKQMQDERDARQHVVDILLAEAAARITVPPVPAGSRNGSSNGHDDVGGSTGRGSGGIVVENHDNRVTVTEANNPYFTAELIRNRQINEARQLGERGGRLTPRR